MNKLKKESIKKESIKKESAKNILYPNPVPQAKKSVEPVEPVDHKIEDFGSTIKESIDIMKEFNLLTVLGDPMAIMMVIGFLFISLLLSFTIIGFGYYMINNRKSEVKS